MQKLQILIVENHRDALMYLKKYLTECGHEVTGVSNFQGALAHLTSTNLRHPVDVLMGDILLPDGSGLELLKHARSHFPSLFSIAMSGIEEHREKCLTAGYDRYLLKPFSPQHLDPLLEEALKFHKKMTDLVLLKKETQDPEKELLKRDLFEVAERERRRIEQELHDSLCQHLLGAAFATKVLSVRLAREGSSCLESAENIARLLSEAVIHARNSCQGLHPVQLKTIGLCKTLAALINSVQRPNISCSFHGDEKIKITDEVTMLHVYRITQECIADILEKGEATYITLSFTQDKTFVYLKITDDSPKEGKLRQYAQNYTMRFLQYRAEAIRGDFKVHSLSPQGTEIICKFPKLL